MSIPLESSYLADITRILGSQWPANRTVNIVCHGHSVPAGYFATPVVDSLNAYPHLLLTALKQRFPFAVINVIVTAIGSETSESGAARFKNEVLCHRPDIVTIDYGLNDRRIGLQKAESAWSSMIAAARKADARVILLTPTPDITQDPSYEGEDKNLLPMHAAQIARLADSHSVGLADSFTACMRAAQTADISSILSWTNHPNRRGHEIVTAELMRWFRICGR